MRLYPFFKAISHIIIYCFMKGFYQFSGTLTPHKAYITYTGASAPKRMRFVFDEEQTTTAIDDQKANAESIKFIENGQLYIISNGVRYDAQGQVVR